MKNLWYDYQVDSFTPEAPKHKIKQLKVVIWPSTLRKTHTANSVTQDIEMTNDKLTN